MLQAKTHPSCFTHLAQSIPLLSLLSSTLHLVPVLMSRLHLPLCTLFIRVTIAALQVLPRLPACALNTTTMQSYREESQSSADGNKTTS